MCSSSPRAKTDERIEQFIETIQIRKFPLEVEGRAAGLL
jgi:hypothetical protein